MWKMSAEQKHRAQVTKKAEFWRISNFPARPTLPQHLRKMVTTIKQVEL